MTLRIARPVRAWPRPPRSATLAINGTTQTYAPAIPADQQAILDALHGPQLTH